MMADYVKVREVKVTGIQSRLFPSLNKRPFVGLLTETRTSLFAP